MITTVGDNMKGYALHRRDSLIITAIDIMDELGFKGLSTREIAKRENVSEATLFRHYSNKNQLLIAVFDYFAKFDEDIFQSTILMRLKPKDAITYFVKSSVEYYENYPAITSIMQVFDVVRYEPELEDKVKSILEHRTLFLKQLIEEAKELGELPSDLNSENLADLINGLCREICLKWRFNHKEFSLTERTMSTLSIILDSLFTS